MRFQRVIVTLAALGMAVWQAPRCDAASTYRWNVTGMASWAVPTNWQPARSAPAADDILIFPNLGAQAEVTNVPTQTIGQLVFESNASVIWYPVSPGQQVLTIAGGAGTDFLIQPGATLMIVDFHGFEIHLNGGTAGTIEGTFAVQGSAERLLVSDPGSLHVTNGGIVLAFAGFTGNLFGVTNLNSVVFEAGSKYQHSAGANPFGASAPNSVVVFQPGSVYHLTAPLSPSMSGRTYGDFIFDVSGSATATGSNPLSVDSILVVQGSLSIALAAPVSIRGSVHVQTGGSLRLGPLSGTATYTFNGTAPQSLILDDNQFAWGSSFDGQAGTTLAIDNPAGVRCPTRPPALSCGLRFIHGNLILDPLSLDPTPGLGAQSRLMLFGGGKFVGASQSTGWIEHGSVLAPMRPSVSSRTFPIGSPVGYAPVTVDYHGLTDSMDVWVRSIVPVGSYYYPYFTMAGLDSTRKVNRYWVLTENSSGNPYTSLDATVSWDPADADAGVDPDQFAFRAKNYPDFFAEPYRDHTVVSRTANSIQAIGLTRTDPNHFYYGINIGEPATPEVSARDAAIAEGNASPGPGLLAGETLSLPVSILPAPVTTVQVDYAVQPGTATGDDFVPTSGTLQFAPGDTVKYVLVPVVGDSDPERHETVHLVLSNPIGCEIVDGDATGTLLDDDDLAAPSVTAVAPNGGEAVEIGSVVDLQWTASDDVAVNHVDLLLTRDGGHTYETVGQNLANTGSYAWTATGPASTRMQLRVVAADDPGNAGMDNSDADWTVGSSVAVDEKPGLAFALFPVAPNPIRHSARIQFAVPRATKVELSILDVRGRMVATLVNGERAAGRHTADWAHENVGPGLYFARFRAPGFNAIERLIVIE